MSYNITKEQYYCIDCKEWIDYISWHKASYECGEIEGVICPNCNEFYCTYNEQDNGDADGVESRDTIVRPMTEIEILHLKAKTLKERVKSIEDDIKSIDNFINKYSEKRSQYDNILVNKEKFIQSKIADLAAIEEKIRQTVENKA